MRLTKLILFLLLFSLAFWPKSILAESFVLGESLPADILKKIPTDLNLTVNETNYPLSQAEISLGDSL